MKLNFIKKDHTQKQDLDQSRPVLRSNFLEKISNDPFLDWVLILIVGVMVVVALVGLDISVYLDTSSGLKSGPSAPTKTKALPLDANLLNKVLEEFENRALKQKAITSGYSVPRDPSLP